jgi:hypothetical protein
MTLMVVVTNPCVVCGKASEVTVESANYEAWRRGMKIQEAFALLSPDERELLISGTHPKCWDILFGEEE